MKTPKIVQSLELEYTCEGVVIYKWEELMLGCTRANKRIINGLVRKHLPGLFQDLALKYYNPYNYYKTSTHLIQK